MVKYIILGLVGLVILAGVAGLALYRPVIQPWHSRWGATDAEVQMVLLGDDIVKGPVYQTTRAIDIHVPADRVWPWLVQIGQGRGGLFSYDWLENLVGCDIHTLDRIVPDLQNLKVGDTIKIGPQNGLPYYKVVMLEPLKALVLRSYNSSTGAPGETWGFYLQENTAGLTRLIIRHRSAPGQDATENTVNAIFDPITFVMERRMLYGLRSHAEKLPITMK